MKLEQVKKTALTEALEDFRDGKSPVDDLEFNDKITVEMPYFSAKAIQDIKNRDEKLKKVLEPVEKAKEELLKDTEAQKEKSEKESKEFKLNESYLKENFADRWVKNENTYTVKCNGRKDLRQLIAEAKASGIKYKFTKLLDEDYKYDFVYTIEGGLQPVEEKLETKEEEPVKTEEKLDEAIQPHKIIVDKYWSSKDSYDDTKDQVYVILPRQKVFAKITRKELFDNGLYRGTFIDQRAVGDTQEEVDKFAQRLINNFELKEVSIEDIKSEEEKTKVNDVAQAFAGNHMTEFKMQQLKNSMMLSLIVK